MATSRFGPAARLLLSLGLACLGAALVLSVPMAIQASAGGAPAFGSGARGVYRLHPSPQLIAESAAVISLLFAAALVLLWRPAALRAPLAAPSHSIPARRQVAISAGATVLLGAAFGGLAFWIERWPIVPGDRRVLWAAAAALGAASLFCAWIPPISVLERRRRPVAPTGRVLCLACGYDLRGLSDLTCPECGHRHTVDELLEGQVTAQPAPVPG